MVVNNPLCTAHAASLATLRSFGCWVAGNSALTPPALGTFGNAGKDLFRGLPFWGLDMSLTKLQRFTDRLSAEFRGEVFNVLNHPNFVVSSNALSSSGFGVETSDVANGFRIGQLALKLIF